MIKPISLCFLIALTGAHVSAQFKNSKLGDISGSAQVNGVAVTVNKRNTKNIVAAVGSDIYTSVDAGVTWSKNKLTSTFGVLGDPALLCTDKGNMLIFHSSDPGGGGLSNDKSLSQIVCQISEDGGKTWDDGNEVESDVTKDHWGPSAALDAKDDVFLTWTKFDQYLSKDTNCLSAILFSKSSNGKKWSRPKELSQTPGNCVDDKLTARSSSPVTSLAGRIFAFWSNQNKIFLDRSFDGGDMWLSNDLAIESLSEECSLCYGMPVMMGDNGKNMYSGSLYVAWPDQRKGSLTSDIWFIRSSNFGDNWTSPTNISGDATGVFEYEPRMTVDKITGYIYVLYFARDAKDNQTEVYVAYSLDGGTTFANAKVSETSFVATDGDFSGNLACNIAAHKGVITSVWTRIDDGKTSLWAASILQEELVKVKAK